MNDIQLKIPGGTITYAPDAPIEIPVPAPAPSPTPEPTPEPLPPIVVPPRSGIFSKPDLIQNMWEQEPGLWVSKDAWRSSVAALQFKLPPLRPGSKITASFSRRAKYPVDGSFNMKILRCSPDPIISYPNWYLGTQKDGGFIFNGEKVEGAKGVVKFYCHYPPHTGEWRKELWEVRYASAPGMANGAVKVTIGGQVILDVTSWQSNTLALPKIANILCIQDDVSNATLPVGSFTSYKDIAIKLEI